MANPNALDFFHDKQKAIDHSMWLNFKYRIADTTFGIINGPDHNWAVLDEATACDMGMSFLDIVPKNYSNMTFKHIMGIRTDTELLPHWEDIIGLFSTTDGEILRFLLLAKIPLEKLIRHELACRGYDENHRWIGFDKAHEIWKTTE